MEDLITSRLWAILECPAMWALSPEALECIVLTLLSLLDDLRGGDPVQFKKRHYRFMEGVVGTSVRPLFIELEDDDLEVPEFAEVLRPFIEQEIANGQ